MYAEDGAVGTEDVNFRSKLISRLHQRTAWRELRGSLHVGSVSELDAADGFGLSWQLSPPQAGLGGIEESSWSISEHRVRKFADFVYSIHAGQGVWKDRSRS